MASTLYTSGTVVTSDSLNAFDRAAYNTLAAVTGTDSLTATGPLSLTAYLTGVRFFFNPQNTNTTNVTININGLGGRAITKLGNTLLIAGDLIPGKIAEIVYDGVGFQLLNPQTFNLTNSVPAANITGQVAVANGGTGAATAQAAKTNLLIPTAGQCKLTTSGANIILNRHNGSYLTINGVQEAIPAAGVTLAPAGTAATTRYYIYAFMNAGVMALEYSTTGHATDATTGIEIKSADATRTLVGQAVTVAAGAWVNTTTSRNVISWFNRSPLVARWPLTAGTIGTTSATLVELDASYRVASCAWVGDPIRIIHSGTMGSSLVGTISLVLTSISGILGVTTSLEGGQRTTIAGNTFVAAASADYANTSPADGGLIIGLYASVSGGGTLTVYNTVGSNATLNLITLG